MAPGARELRRGGAPKPEPSWLNDAADYQVYLFRRERPTLSQAVSAHEALLAAEDQAAADRWALDWIVEPLNTAGLYAALLADWLPTICRSPEPAVRAEALNQAGKQHLHIGSYDVAHTYPKQSLATVIHEMLPPEDRIDIR